MPRLPPGGAQPPYGCLHKAALHEVQSLAERPEPARRGGGGGERQPPSEQAAVRHPLSEDALVASLTGLQRVPQAGRDAEQVTEVAHVQLAVLA